MPNLKGGKNYKKMKHDQGAKPELHDIGDGQMIGRVLQMLGDRQARVYCNDNIERICKIRGKLRKKVWIATSDIVLISLRDFSSIHQGEDSDSDIEAAAPTTSSNSRGDILAKYDNDVYSKLKKIDGVNKKLFGTMDGSKPAQENEEDYFNFDGADEDGEGNDDDDEGAVGPKKKAWKRPSSSAAAGADDDVDIDAI